MTVTAKTVSLTTDGSGVASIDIRLYGTIVALGFRLGTLSTPDWTVTDQLTGTVIYAKAGMSVDTRATPRTLVQDATGADVADVYDKPAVTGLLRIAIAGGGASKTGEVVIVHE